MLLPPGLLMEGGLPWPPVHVGRCQPSEQRIMTLGQGMVPEPYDWIVDTERKNGICDPANIHMGELPRTAFDLPP